MTGCENVFCENEGTCEPTYTNNEHGYLCECVPGYTGDFCEIFTDLSLTSPFTYVTNQENDYLDLSLRVQTTLTLMVIVSNDLFQLELDVTGKLNFTIFGSSIESEKAVNHGEWVEVVVKYKNAEATLRYRDTKCDDWCESSSALTESENFSFRVIVVGSNVNYDEMSKFVGCVEDFKVNSELLVGGQKGVPTSTSQCYRVEQCGQMSCNAQGTCIDLWSKFECQCFDMYAGEFCQKGKRDIGKISFILINENLAAKPIFHQFSPSWKIGSPTFGIFSTSLACKRAIDIFETRYTPDPHAISFNQERQWRQEKSL